MPSSGLWEDDDSKKRSVQLAHTVASCLSGFVGASRTHPPRRRRQRTAPPRPRSPAVRRPVPAAGSTAASIVQPLDVVRTRVQLAAAEGARVSSAEALRGILARGAAAGGRGAAGELWRGARPAMARLGVGNATYFLWLQVWRRVFARRDPPPGAPALGPAQTFLAGGASGLCTSLVLTPLTLVKTRAEGGLSGGGGVLRAMRAIVRAEGPRGLARGLVPTALTVGPFAALFLALYTEARRGLEERWGGEGGAPRGALAFASGCIAAAGATAATQPMDVVRTRIQAGAAGAGAGGAGAGGAGAGVAAVVARILSREGPAGLFTGFAPRVMKRGLQTALVFSLFEEIRPRVDALAVRCLA